MNRERGITIIAIAVVILLTTASMTCIGAEQGEQDERSERMGRGPMLPEMAEQMFEQLREKNPEKAAELDKLRETDPEAFHAEFRKAMHAEFGEPGGRGMEGPGRDRDGRRGPGGERGGGRGRGGEMRENFTEFITWFEKEYPEKAKELAELKEKDQRLYMQRLKMSYRRYRRIFEASKDNPELAKVLKEDMQLRRQVYTLRKQISSAKDETSKKNLAEQLKVVLGKRYDTILKRKQIEYESLLVKLEKLKEQIKQSKVELQERSEAEFKQQNVDARLKELLSDKKKRFRWD